jgi:hypothetical protein
MKKKRTEPDNMDARIKDLLAEGPLVALYFTMGISVLKEQIETMKDEEIIQMFSSFLHPQMVRNNVKYLFNQLNGMDNTGENE